VKGFGVVMHVQRWRFGWKVIERYSHMATATLRR
jgi:hypothetical protein